MARLGLIDLVFHRKLVDDLTEKNRLLNTEVEALQNQLWLHWLGALTRNDRSSP
jgi:hypothetical protein